MARPDLWRWSAARAEIDHRSREARLQLENLERLLITRASTTQSLIRRVLYRRGMRLLNGGRVQSHSSKIDPAGIPRGEVRHIPAETRGATVEWARSARVVIGGMTRGPSAA